MSISMSFTINATTAAELSRGIKELAAIISDAASVTQPTATSNQAAVPSQLPEPATGTVQIPAQNASTPSVTKEDVRAKLSALIQSGVDVQPLLEEFGAKRLSDIPPHRYPELMKRAGELAQ